MPCYNPWPAWETTDGNIVLFPRHGQDIKRERTLTCGNCVGCRLEKSRQWAIRCMHEAQMHEENCFLTLTYNEENLPPGRSLVHADFQKFMKRLRIKIKIPIKFYMCGEYGEDFSRPHFHACIFGYNFPDREPIKKLSDTTLYRSASLEKLWTKGYSSIGAVTFQSAAYVARYVMKKVNGQPGEAHYTYVDPHGEIHQRTPEYNQMSRAKGLGKEWFKKFHTDVYPSDQLITNGYAGKPPRYYDLQYQELNPLGMDEVKALREFRLEKGENTDARLRTRETVVKARIANTLKRKL